MYLCHDSACRIVTKLNTIKKIATILKDLLPVLIEGYEKSIADERTLSDIPSDILPLITINVKTIMKEAQQIQASLRI